MKKKEFLIGLLFSILSCGIIQGQQSNGELKLSLKEAQDYAIMNNKQMIASRMDVASSKLAIWDIISGGLPQVAIGAGFTDNLKLGVFLLPDFIGGDPTKKTPITMGSKFNSNVTLQASMLLFNAPYLVGIETMKLANKLAETNVKNTELDTRQEVATSFYLILVSEESLRILDNNIANLKETLKSTKAMFSAGVAESTDIDQMTSNVTMSENTRSTLERNIEMNYNLLRFQLGVKPETKITLSETLDQIEANINVETLLSQGFNYMNNLNYELIDGQVKMSAMSLKSAKSQTLPSLSVFYTNSKTGMDDKLSTMPWYNSSAYGFQLAVPIFGSGQKYTNIKKARINYEKAVNSKEMVVDQLLLQEKQLRYNLVNANLQYTSQKDNVNVSKRVYASMENKYKQGMASSLELTQANSQYLQAENNYVSALMNLLQTKLALDKLLNNMN
jgi:outer membrane protein